MGKSRSSKKYANKYKCSYTGWWVLVILIIFHVLHKNMVLQMLPHSTGDQSKVICAKIFPQNCLNWCQLSSIISHSSWVSHCALGKPSVWSLFCWRKPYFALVFYQFKLKKVNIRLPNKSDIKANIPNLISQSNWTSPNGSKTKNWWATNMDPPSPRHDRGQIRCW